MKRNLLNGENSMEELKLLQKISENPYSYAREWKKRTNGRVIGHLCTYTPEELIHASGALSVRILDNSEDYTLADSHLQSYSCSLVRSALQNILNKELDFLNASVFPHTCDSIQRLSDIWRLNSGIALHFDIVLPVKLDTKSSQEYVTDLFKKFRKDLEKSFDIEITDEDIKNSIKLYNDIRSGLKELYNLKDKYPQIIPGSDILTIVKASMVMDRKDFLTNLTIILSKLNDSVSEQKNSDNIKRIILSGGICTHPDIYKTIENAGAAVIWDDLCSGSRYFEGIIKDSDNPIKDLSDRYNERINCPAKFYSLTSRGDHLLELVKKHQADGVIFLFLKFCDPQGFDYPYMKEMLDKEGITNILFELDDKLPPIGQLETRFQALIEIL
jgi:benzoyl-CoA reductase subunit C